MNRRQLLTTTAAMLLLHRQASAAFAAGNALPDLSTFGLSGALPSVKGKVVYLDFWASWCAPCKASFPVINGWHQQLGPKGFMVLGISVDETEAAMNDFLKKNVVAFPVVRDAGQKLVSAASVQTMPTSFIIDRKGIIRHVHNGFRKRDEATLLSQIQALL